MNAAQNGNIFGLTNNNSINNQNMNFNQNFMNQNMMMGNQNMNMMGNPNMMMGNQNMMMGNPNMMMGNQNMMMGNPNMMMAYLNMMMRNKNLMIGNQNCLNNQNNNMGFNNMASINGINMNNTNINSDIINDANIKKDFNIHDKEEIFPRNKEITTDVKNNGDLIYIHFVLSTGSKVTIEGNKNSTFKEMGKKLCQKINLDERYLENRMKFLFNAETINLDQKTTLKDLFCHSNPSVTVYDDDNIIGT